jgi:hypothetical protein
VITQRVKLKRLRPDSDCHERQRHEPVESEASLRKRTGVGQSKAGCYQAKSITPADPNQRTADDYCSSVYGYQQKRQVMKSHKTYKAYHNTKDQ